MVTLAGPFNARIAKLRNGHYMGLLVGVHPNVTDWTVIQCLQKSVNIFLGYTKTKTKIEAKQ